MLKETKLLQILTVVAYANYRSPEAEQAMIHAMKMGFKCVDLHGPFILCDEAYVHMRGGLTENRMDYSHDLSPLQEEGLSQAMKIAEKVILREV